LPRSSTHVRHADGSGAATALDALALGASDYATKPSNTGNLQGTLAQIREQLIPKIKALCATRAGGQAAAHSSAKPVPLPGLLPAHREGMRIEVLAIGTSKGGPNALGELIPRIPADFPVPIVIVQHMPRLFTRLLASRLNDNSAITVQEGRRGAQARRRVDRPG
jgi:two-component system chemotaxis response regulator CheB